MRTSVYPSFDHRFSFLYLASFKYNRLDKSQAMLLIVDLQEGLFQMARDFTPVNFMNNILAHAELGRVFNLPTILTTSAETG